MSAHVEEYLVRLRADQPDLGYLAGDALQVLSCDTAEPGAIVATLDHENGYLMTELKAGERLAG